jgi:signal peptidase I
MRKVRRGAAAFLLSLCVPGLGQVFNGQFFVGIVIFLVYVALMFSAGFLHLLLSFPVAVAYMLVSWSFQIIVAIVAGRTAVRQVIANDVAEFRWLSFLAGAALVVTAMLVFSIGRFPDGILGVRTFKIPSDSMRPTIIVGDHLMVDMRYYTTHRPERGKLAVYLTPGTNVIYVKRIVAVGGDTIAADRQGTIVNGKRVPEPYVYLDAAGPDPATENFGPITVPSNQIFVMGDNRYHSYDSRYTGTVSINRVIGKPLYVYYSDGNLSRIGHVIE